MAEKLTAAPKGATVHKLPDRAAKGAGKSKPTKPTVELKSTAPKPKTRAERDAEIRKANLDRRLVLASQDRQIDVKVEVIREQLKTLLQQRKQVRDAIQGTGIPLKLYDEAKADSLTSRVDLEEKERLRAEAREIFGVPTGVEKGLFDDLPDAAKEEAHWADMGYRAGRAGLDRDPPSECPPERQQTYMAEWERAQAEILAAIERTGAATTGAAPAPGEPMTLDEAAASGKQPPEDPNASHVSPPAEPDAPAVDPAIEAEADQVVAETQAEVEREAEDDFEMSDEERQAQQQRRAVQDARETDTELEPHGAEAQAERIRSAGGGIV